MKIKLRTVYASPTLTASPGDVIELSADEARGLLSGGFAEAVKAEVETADAPPPENAATRTGRPKKGA